ncbi:MAG TPA: NAD(P)-binding domain-containing protein [Candidatus Paceibacterota bacterium]|nr:NAD(P)-binding domain-containing protein [Candidatus Paceibacterota bacterium]
MNIAIIGTGNVGSALAHGLKRAGHRIFFGVRDTNNFKNTDTVDGTVITAHPVAEAVAESTVVIIAVPADAVPDAARSLGDVSGKVIIDTTNAVMKKPEGYPDGFAALKDITKSPDVVKCFNSTGAENMMNPRFGETRIDMFVAGASEKGKMVATTLAKEIGFENVYDFGGDDKVALLEEFAMAWINLALMQNQGRNIAFKVIRRP